MERSHSVSTVAGILDVSNHTVYRLIQSGKLQAFKVGNVWRINESTVEDYRRPTPPKRNPRTERDRIRSMMRAS